jgi:hypothetical protein
MAHTLRRSKSKYGRTRRQRQHKKQRQMRGGFSLTEFIGNFTPKTDAEKCKAAKEDAQTTCSKGKVDGDTEVRPSDAPSFGQPGASSDAPSFGQPGASSDAPSFGQPGASSDAPSFGQPGASSDAPSFGQPGASSDATSLSQPGAYSPYLDEYDDDTPDIGGARKSKKKNKKRSQSRRKKTKSRKHKK